MRYINSAVLLITLCVTLVACAVLAPLAAARVAYFTGFNPSEIIATKATAAVGEPEPGGYAAPVDLATEAFGAEVPMNSTRSPQAIAITPDGTRAYVVDTGDDEVVPIDIATNTEEAPIAVGDFPLAIAITPDGTRAYVVNRNDETVTPIDISSGATGPLIDTGERPSDIAITPNGTRAYVTNEDEDTVSRINLDTGVNAKTIAAGDEPSGVAITPDGTRAYVTNEADGTVTRIDLNTDTPGKTISVGGDLKAIGITPDAVRAYVLGLTDPVSEIDLGTDTAGPNFSLGPTNSLFNIAVAPDGLRAYAVDRVGAQLAYFDVPSSAFTAAIAVGEAPEAMAIVPNQGPHAAFSGTSVVLGEATSFNAAASSDSDGSAARYDWDFGDGTLATNGGPTPSHSYAAAGTYVVTLTVTDNEGCSTTIVFTGQTALCNGSALARTTRTVTVAPSGQGVKGKKKRRCPKVASRAMTFVPKLVPGHVVPGVRVRMASNRSVRIRVRATLIWVRDGHRHKARMGSRSARINGWIRVRFPVPARLRDALPYHRKVKVKLRIRTLPRSKSNLCARLSERTVGVRIVKVFPHAVQRGSLP